MSVILATYLRRRLQDSGSDSVIDYYVHEFTKIVDEQGQKFPLKWIKETKLTSSANFIKGKEYKLTLSRDLFPDAINLPYPTTIEWDDEKVYIKGGNSIIKVGKDKVEHNLSVPLNREFGFSNYDIAALNKLRDGRMTEELLMKMNAKGIYFKIEHSDPQDKRKNPIYSIGFSNSKKVNLVIVKQESKEEVNRELRSIKQQNVKPELQKHFTFQTEILTPKKRKSR